MYIYVNGSFVQKEEANISVYDHGFMYGLGLFETFSIKAGHPFLLDDHLKRLCAGLQSFGVKWHMSRERVVNISQKLLRLNGLTDAYVRLNVSAGEKEIGLYTGTYCEPTTIIYIKRLPPTPLQPKRGKIVSLRRNTPEGLERLKSHHFLNNILARRELKDEPDNVEGIFLTEDGYVAEGIVSNIFWIKNNTVYTPSVQTGILNGITRQFVLALLNKNNIKTEVGLFEAEQLLQADAAFITNSIQEIVPLDRCDYEKYDVHADIITFLKNAFKKYRTTLWSRAELVGG